MRLMNYSNNKMADFLFCLKDHLQHLHWKNTTRYWGWPSMTTKWRTSCFAWKTIFNSYIGKIQPGIEVGHQWQQNGGLPVSNQLDTISHYSYIHWQEDCLKDNTYISELLCKQECVIQSLRLSGSGPSWPSC